MAVALATAPFNNFSPELKAKLSPLKPGQVARYQLLGDNLPPSFRLPPSETIYDPWAKRDDGGVGEYITLVNAKDTHLVMGERVPNAREIKFESASGGIITVDGSDPVKYAKMELSALNADNPVEQNRATMPLYKRIKPERDAKAKVAYEMQVDEARAIIRGAEGLDLIFLGREFGRNVEPDYDDNGEKTYDRLKADLYQIAKDDPEGIISRQRSEHTKAHALVRDLAQRGVVRFDESEGAWRMTDTTEVLCAVAANVSREDGVVKWLTGTADGRAKAEQFKAHLKTVMDKESKRR